MTNSTQISKEGKKRCLNCDVEIVPVSSGIPFDGTNEEYIKMCPKCGDNKFADSKCICFHGKEISCPDARCDCLHCFNMPQIKEGKCSGVHCKCMNLDGECPNRHAGDCVDCNPYLSCHKAPEKCSEHCVANEYEKGIFDHAGCSFIQAPEGKEKTMGEALANALKNGQKPDNQKQTDIAYGEVSGSEGKEKEENEPCCTCGSKLLAHKCTGEKLSKLEIDFDYECGDILLEDEHCGNILYRNLAHWENIKSFLKKAISQAKEEGYKLGQSETRSHYYEKCWNDAVKSERQRIKGIVEGMRRNNEAVTMSQSVCSKCGFATDHQECQCKYNQALSDLLSALTTKEE